MEKSELLRISSDFFGRLHLLKKEDILILREVIREHNRLYYQEESPIVSDMEYDQLFHALARLEADFDMMDEDSPTARLAVLTSEQFQKVRHIYPMISLDNTYSADEVRDFEERMRNILRKNLQNLGDFDYYIQPKYDGLGLALVYQYGVLVQGVTRWSGVEGEDVTLGVLEIANIPKKIDALGSIERMEIRGEVMMSRKTFDRVNAERLSEGEKLFANPRNAASGSLRQINPLITRTRNLEFFAYSIPQIEQNIDKNFNISSYHEMMELLEKWGFERKDFSLKMTYGIENLIQVIERETKWYLGEKTNNQQKNYFDFDIDGMVIKLDDMKLWDILWRTEHHPRYSIAYKFPAKQVRTKVLSIEHSVGRTGTVTPVANLEPVDVTGVIVKRATLHNYDELAKKWVREGDSVFIMRAWEVIPEIVSVIADVRDGSENIVLPPENCPICHTTLEQEEGKVAIFCPNKHCPAKIQGQLEMLVSKQAMNIDGFGEKQIELFLELWWITDFASIFSLSKYHDELLKIEGYKEKSVNNLFDAIEKARNTTLDRAFVALGIPNVGKKTAKQIVTLFDDIFDQNWLLQKIFEITEENLLNLADIGPETARAFVNFMSDNRQMVEKFFWELNFSFSQEKNKNSSILSGKSFCVTGSFDTISRDEIHSMIEQNGGEVRTSVSKNLDFLIAGEKAGSKLEKAENLDVKILTLDDFFELIK